jgi:prepilin-type N-terminal cleavage/methylation domain-containing protein
MSRAATALSGTKAGATLVEVMIALVVLAIVALGVASFVYYGRGSVYAQRDRLSVLELVNGRLELLRASSYGTVTPPDQDYAVYHMLPVAGGGWSFSASREEEELTVNSRTYPMTTTVQYVDVDGGSPSYDALKFTVSMQYRTGSTDEMTLRTYRSP